MHIYQTTKAMRLSVFKNRKPEKVEFSRTKAEKKRLKAIADSLKLLDSLEVLDF